MVKMILPGSPQPNNRRSARSSGERESVRTTVGVFPMGWKKFFTGYRTVCAIVDGRRKAEPQSATLLKNVILITDGQQW